MTAIFSWGSPPVQSISHALRNTIGSFIADIPSIDFGRAALPLETARRPDATCPIASLMAACYANCDHPTHARVAQRSDYIISPGLIDNALNAYMILLSWNRNLPTTRYDKIRTMMGLAIARA
jgi:hypothetical protein